MIRMHAVANTNRNAVLLGLLLGLTMGCSGGSAANSSAANGGAANGNPLGAKPTGQKATISFVIDGAGHSNETLVIDEENFTLIDTPAIYFSTGDYTEMNVYDRPDDGGRAYNYANLYFKGETAATEQLGDAIQSTLYPNVQVDLSLSETQDYYSCCNSGSPVGASGTLTVTSYGSVGGLVQGTFQGTFPGVENSALVTISNGQFSFTRLPDARPL